jgi:hypothetical protein
MIAEKSAIAAGRLVHIGLWLEKQGDSSLIPARCAGTVIQWTNCR